ncbi:MAG TPA: bifunctional UDP-N-acetylglucosamine diphosphorylase/glucosamine-1-phosphate N-acetyltransferase GlmU [Thermotogota bacterium]|nr:bifunctional UDP-N-acetylglucosamine diphosphorylase/glucosamine-1-phosphate N-acetyltransferase GlmU [Thermotogota bacterium]HPR95956.1 bifunctional UDP-N-acetylglucosamine diphosphorylase/glucosamine-1-phosphate N-acetyltransferase GlmU [Thermotogota bacterium]
MLGIILAAGMGTRMKSEKPKVMHQLLNHPLLEWVLNSFKDLMNDEQYDKIAVVIGEEMPEVEGFLKGWASETGKSVSFFYQRERLGTGHAVKCALPILEKEPEKEPVFILCGDVPLIKSETLKKMQADFFHSKADGVVLTVNMSDPSGYGRIIKNSDGTIREIVEHKDATEEQLKIREINSGIYMIKSLELVKGLKELKNDNAQNEYYLTDIVSLMNNRDKKVISVITDDHYEVSGINNRLQLSEMENEAKRRINERHLLNGVTITDPLTTYIDPSCAIGQDCIIEPMTFIRGKTRIGKRNVIGPMTQIENCQIGDDNRIERSHLYEVEIENEVKVGPFARLREKTILRTRVKIGDFVETKKTEIGKGSKAQHLTYLGDTTIGEGVNIGAGTITCNYDGYSKHKTFIDDNAFIGSNSSLVAPVNIGKDVIIGAGSVIVKDVDDNDLSIARGRQANYNNRGKELKNRLKNRKLEGEGEI